MTLLDVLTEDALSHAKLTSAASPEEALVSMIQAAAGLEKLPTVRELRLYHIRCVGAGETSTGETVRKVVFEPEFLYVLDLGLQCLAGVRISLRVSGAGDPSFPDFSASKVVSIQNHQPAALLYPSTVRELLIGVKAGTTIDAVRQALQEYTKSVRPFAEDAFVIEVAAFREPEIGQTLKSKFDFVTYTQTNRTIRVIDIRPGWLIDRVL